MASERQGGDGFEGEEELGDAKLVDKVRVGELLVVLVGNKIGKVVKEVGGAVTFEIFFESKKVLGSKVVDGGGVATSRVTGCFGVGEDTGEHGVSCES